eukprot:TRINITY_DN2656_c0_g2_i2.p1 TRINITY_DN2656_c0_g2~~TRINITY_DN2656_c0_g2_i2.p1  ORF type:complete len:197 (-),score=37.98 TRINITY_DN2656_c0_g2_i2:180-770(-)
MPATPLDVRRRKDNRNGGAFPSKASDKEPDASDVLKKHSTADASGVTPSDSVAGLDARAGARTKSEALPVALITVVVVASAILVMLMLRGMHEPPSHLPVIPFPEDIDAIVEQQLQEYFVEHGLGEEYISDTVDGRLQHWLSLYEGKVEELRRELGKKVSRADVEVRPLLRHMLVLFFLFCFILLLFPSCLFCFLN